MAGRHRSVAGALLVVLQAVLPGCATRITSRAALLQEEGWRPPGRPPAAAWRSGELDVEVGRYAAPRRDIVEAALAERGAADLDCSGLVVRAYAAGGLEVPRTVRQQLAAGRAISLASLQPGDLVFFAFRRSRPDHVGIYAGRGAFVHVSRAARSVRLESLADAPFAGRLVAARSLVPEPPH